MQACEHGTCDNPYGYVYKFEDGKDYSNNVCVNASLPPSYQNYVPCKLHDGYYWDGATFATNEGHPEHKGVTFGNNINMYIKRKIDKPFMEWIVQNDQMYLHEYGHTIQGNVLGAGYLLAIGLPSLISAWGNEYIKGDPYGADTHSYFYTETWANRLAARYFSIFNGYSWDEYDGYPFYDYR